MFKITPNALDKFAGYLSPAWGASRLQARAALDFVARYSQMESGRERPSESSGTSTEEQEHDMYDRLCMISSSRRLCRENPLVGGIMNTFVNNIVGATGSRPMPDSGDKEFDKRALDYFLTWAESPELRGMTDYWNYQQILMRSILCDGDAGTVLTNTGLIQGIEADRIQTPQMYASLENFSMMQGVQIAPLTGAPERYWLLNRDRYGNFDHYNPVSVPNYNFIHSFRVERFSQYRGFSALFSAYDWIRDMDEIADFVKFSFKVQSVFAVALKGKADSQKPRLGGMVSRSSSSDSAAKIDLNKGSILDLDKLGAEDIKIIAPTAAGPEFTPFMRFLATMIGVSLGLPVDFVLLSMHDGNYSSQRMAMRVTYKTFLMWWSILARFNQRTYIWKMNEGVRRGKLNVPASIRGTFTRCAWSSPIAESADPEKEAMASLLSMAAGLSTRQIEAAARGRDWESLAAQLQLEIETYLKNNVPWVIAATPGLPILQDLNASIKQKEAAAARNTVTNTNPSK